MATVIPNIVTWSIVPQKGTVTFYDDMNVWLGETNTVVGSWNTSLNATNAVNQEINDIYEQIRNADPTSGYSQAYIDENYTRSLDTLADLRALNIVYGSVKLSGYYTKNDGAFGDTFYRLKGLKTSEVDNGGTIIVTTINAIDYVYELEYDMLEASYFGLVADGAFDNILRLRALCEFMDDTGQSVDFESGGAYYINWLTLGTDATEEIRVLHTFNNTHGITFNFNGSTLVNNIDQDSLRLLFRFDNSSQITFKNGTVRGTLLTDTLINHKMLNLQLVNYRENCSSVIFENMKCENIYRMAVYGVTTPVGEDSTDRVTERCTDIIYTNVELENCKYGYYANNSGDHMKGNIKSTNLLRTIYILNATHHNIDIESTMGGNNSDVLITNQIDDNYPASKNKISNIDIAYTSNGKVVGSGVTGLYESPVNIAFIKANQGSTLGGSIKDIKIHFDLHNRVDAFTNIVSLLKWYNPSGTIIPDLTANGGHTLRNIEITGEVRGGSFCTQSIIALPQRNYNIDLIDWSGNFFSNINVHDFVCDEAPADFGVYVDGISATNVNTPLLNLERVKLGGDLVTANTNFAVISVKDTIANNIISSGTWITPDPVNNEIWHSGGYLEGSNANGSYRKYVDGRLECFFTSVVSQSIASAYGSLFQTPSPSLVYPHAFTSIDSIIGLSSENVGISWGTIDSFSLTSCVVRLQSGLVGSTAYPAYIAKGRWK